jgi:hypothetical protein
VDLWRQYRQDVFRHQFRLISTPAVKAEPIRLPTKHRPAARGAWRPVQAQGHASVPRYRTRWSPVAVKPRKPIGLAALKAQERRRERQRLRRELAAAKRQSRRHYWEAVTAQHRPDENQLARPVLRRSGPMSRSELYEWHKAMGTLREYFSLFPK